MAEEEVAELEEEDLLAAAEVNLEENKVLEIIIRKSILIQQTRRSTSFIHIHLEDSIMLCMQV